jgi:hypothetical protein
VAKTAITARRINHFIDRYCIIVAMALQQALPLLFLLAITQQQVDHTPIAPLINHVKVQPIIGTVPAKHSFKATFDDIGEEISGTVY